jgi:hypothetical protein
VPPGSGLDVDGVELDDAPFGAFSAPRNREGDSRFAAVVGDTEAAGVEAQVLEGVGGAAIFPAQPGPLADDRVARLFVRLAPRGLEPAGRGVAKQIGQLRRFAGAEIDYATPSRVPGLDALGAEIDVVFI